MITRYGRYLACLLAAITALGTVPALAAQPVATPISFDLSSATCSQVPAGTTIHGTGTAQFSVTSVGNVHSVISGTATDNVGSFWRFNYTQDVRPLVGGAVEITDHFNLVGSGSPIKLHSHFVADFTSSDLETADVLAIKQVHGDPIGCDPI
jgi:hypothetical protein